MTDTRDAATLIDDLNMTIEQPDWVGAKLTLLKGWGIHTGEHGQDFHRVETDTPVTVTVKVGDMVYFTMPSGATAYATVRAFGWRQELS